MSRASRSSAAFPRGSVPDADAPEAPGTSPLAQAPPAGTPSPGPGRATRRSYREGDVIGGKYRLRYVLGEGGMGMVWLARNDVLHIDVAVKFIRREVNSPEATMRLLQEARAAARIDHPSIVRVLDFGESEHLDPFIVMEMLRGDQLVEALERKRRFSPAAALRILLPIASALVAAHDRKIVHRDLKPENILLVKNDRGDVTPKIVDFGIAKVWSETSSGEVTMTGTVLGSPDYMSPEQARGISDVDGQTDIWAFSVVLYETITGQKPFQGGNYHDLVKAILREDPAPITALGVGDAALWGIIARGLAKERSARWGTMREMGEALARWALDNGVEDDVTGTSLAAHWLSDGGQRPLSDRPTMRAPRPSSPAAEEPPARREVAHQEAAQRPLHQPPRRWRLLVLALVALAVLGATGAALVALRAGAARDGSADLSRAAPAPPPALAPPAGAPEAAQTAPAQAAPAQATPAQAAPAQADGAASAPGPAREAGPQPGGTSAAGAPRREPADGGTSAAAGEPAAASRTRTAGARRAAPRAGSTRTSPRPPGSALPVPARPNF
ncbi:serine/threonine-protein kinase [Sorangium sp. So ce1036]|uniref:serine/threonine-protein kinase n=1 Tax=Sorangium sp. So ce1036 TaxID=3133328 RepID=UPI003EFBAD63